MEDVYSQPRRWDRCDGPLRRPDTLLSAALRLADSIARPAPDLMARRNDTPNRRMGCPATHRSLRLGMDTKLHHPRSRPGLWRDFHPALRAIGIRDQPIAPRSSWQNQMQVFLWTLEQRLADASTQRLANLANASLCISLSQDFEPDDDDLRVAELVAYALVQRREALSAKLLGRLGMYSINPLLGLLGAHLMLHDQKEPSRDVFLGYCSSSRATAASLKNFLQSTGAAVLDWQTDFIAGRSILAQIEEAASRCNAGIFTKNDDRPDHPLTQRCRMRGRAALPEGHRHWRKGARPRPSAHPALQESLRAAASGLESSSRGSDLGRSRACGSYLTRNWGFSYYGARRRVIMMTDAPARFAEPPSDEGVAIPNLNRCNPREPHLSLTRISYQTRNLAIIITTHLHYCRGVRPTKNTLPYAIGLPLRKPASSPLIVSMPLTEKLLHEGATNREKERLDGNNPKPEMPISDHDRSTLLRSKLLGLHGRETRRYRAMRWRPPTMHRCPAVPTARRRRQATAIRR
jgi:hypothetical protein